MKWITYLMLGMVVSMIAACGGAQTPPTSVPISAFSVGDVRLIDNESRPLSLSPDGTWLSTIQADQLCVIASDTLTQKACTTVKRLDVNSLAWSSDSTRLAWTEDWARMFVDSDIWTLDLNTGTATNLTDDGTQDDTLNNPQAMIDMSPTWSRDGKTLYFARSNLEAKTGTSIYRIAATGGTPQSLVRVSEMPGAILTPIIELDNGDLIYSVLSSDIDHPSNGIWRMTADGKNPEQLIQKLDDGGLPVLLNAKGTQAVIMSSSAGNFAITKSPFYLLDLATKTVKPIQQQESALIVTAATLSPDGAKLLYAQGNSSKATTLTMRNLADGTEREFTPFEQLDYIIVGSNSLGRALYWSSSNLIFGTAQGKFGVLVQLKTP